MKSVPADLRSLAWDIWNSCQVDAVGVGERDLLPVHQMLQQKLAKFTWLYTEGPQHLPRSSAWENCFQDCSSSGLRNDAVQASSL